MIDLQLQQVPPQPVPGDNPIPPLPDPEHTPQPITDPTQEPPPMGDPDVIDPGSQPEITPPMVA